VGGRYPRYNSAVFPKLGPATKLLLVPPVYGSRTPCTAQPPSVWCTQQTYAQWLELNRGNLSFVSALCVRCWVCRCAWVPTARSNTNRNNSLCADIMMISTLAGPSQTPASSGLVRASPCSACVVAGMWLPTLRVLKGN
jgi:hypothetical protein